MTTSHYTEYGTLPTMTEQEKQDILTAKELPSVSAADNGKALIVNSGAWAKKAIPSQLPSVSSDDNGKALIVDGGKWTKKAIPAELPAVTAADNGSILKVVDGAWAVVAPEP